jgi:hypothetical protein
VEEVDYAEGIIAAQHLLGRAAQGGGDLASAYATFRRSLDASRRIGHHAALSQALVDLAGAMADAGDTPRARALLDLADRERARHRLPTRPVDARARVELLEQLDRVGVGGSRRYADVDAALADLPAAVAPLSPPAVC